MSPFISIILPVYRQADHIQQIVCEYNHMLAKVINPYEIILVVNGTGDESLAICSCLAEKDSRIRVFYSESKGWGRAVRTGLREAQGDLLCYTNSARTSPQDLILMLKYAVDYPNVVIKANRKIRQHRLRRIGSLLYNIECRVLFDLSCWDINGTPKVFPRTFHKLINLTCDDDLLDLEFVSVCRREGYPMLEVPIFSSRRYGGVSTTNCRSAIRMYMGAVMLWQSVRKGIG